MDLPTIQSWLLAWAFTAPRVLVTFALLPVLTEPVLPSTLRNGIILILSMFVLPLTHEQFLNIKPDTLSMLGIMVKEGVLGLLLGYTLSIPFWAVKAAGFLIDMQRGVMSSLFFSQMTADMVSPLGNLFNMFLTTLLLVSGGFLVLLKTLFLSYQTWPIDQFFPQINLEVASFFLQQLDLLLYTSLLLAGPLIGIMFLIDFGTGLVGRFLPQLNVFLITMPIKSGLTFFVLALYIELIAKYLKDGFFSMGDNLKILDALLR
ncbi:type III secretion system export apparatus subunit SctT [Candidatus Thiothrix sp. Deng01]|uniref:Type III secretion system export apparatus subunit SctT n=1 Tax=Candidatus Thiothrix phosphatis TaxID=3112415 RepID=A0ABU6CRK3_9GAMM|nr:type III secretion system export apparatus subunit SctT [Candidatus Thiothrix sp. Deng01]MEB4589424.1 type III secretion system export apparatus subunit SctT [Candidatus Thiothrix sp. Deng01]